MRRDKEGVRTLELHKSYVLRTVALRRTGNSSEQVRSLAVARREDLERVEENETQQLLLTGTSSCSALATIPQDPDELPPTQPLPPTTAADHLIPRTEMIQHHQLTITGD
ncbi:hypothetical protein AVEN_214642-1 [Araneus ventricosus]|uniref:Uncharacterized protein n=1 Tax=Araneus ventricosus TaxID=182803 RepID=A0A4Y2LCV0_ARAVE|nr:hypothetical protein AVEN_214642-1 [Araneus ventricosus]